MKKYFSLILFGIIILAFLTGCGGGKSETMYKAKKKGPGGMPVMQNVIDSEKRGKEAIKLSDEISYPGMEPYEGSHYEFVAKESPEKVANWFIEKLEGEVVNKKASQNANETEWRILYKDYEIVVAHGPETDSALIRYKLAPKAGK